MDLLIECVACGPVAFTLGVLYILFSYKTKIYLKVVSALDLRIAPKSTVSNTCYGI